MSYLEYAEAGFHVFGLHGADSQGHCLCGHEDCDNAYKHPMISNWQKTPRWSQEQLEVMDEAGQFDTGFGVVVRDNHLVVDVDPRNGGLESMERLPLDPCQFVVATGGGGYHYYYKIPDGVALVTKHAQFPGIDFKTSGYVVGYGSMHKSGIAYELERGDIANIGAAPVELLDLLRKPEQHRTELDGQAVDVSDKELHELLGYINPDCDYEQWVRVGMALHEITSGEGFDLWDAWSATGDKYNPAEMDHKWHSFGKSVITVGYGTLRFYAEANGYVEPVTFDAIEVEVDNRDDYIDLQRPPGLVGKLTDWINTQCRYPRERLATAAALTAIGNLAGLKYKDGEYGVTSNLFTFCVAGSATGKDDVMSAMFEAMIAAGMPESANGTIKSEQEIVRALIHSPEVCYIIDEIGILLSKITNATRRGTASYLEGVIGMLMQVYSKADRRMPLSFDVRLDAQKQVSGELASIQKKIDENEKYNEARFEELKQLLADLQYGLSKPFLSLIGFTTPVTFQKIVDYEQSVNGFIGRSLLIQEKETNPAMSKVFTGEPMPMGLHMALAGIHEGAQRGQEKKGVESTPEALKELEEIYEYFFRYSEQQKVTGLEAISRRAFELVLKVSLILSMGEGVRTVEHVRWAFAYVKADVVAKINLAAANVAESYKAAGEELGRRILNRLDEKEGVTTGVLINGLRKFKKEDVEGMLEHLERNGVVVGKEGASKGPKTKIWYLGNVSNVSF